jgi:homoserine O-acetyltransferase
MKVSHMLRHAVFTAAVCLAAAGGAAAADYPPPRQADFVVHDFTFHSGATMPELRLHYTTIGDPSGEPVLILHGTGGTGGGFLTPAFAGELFGPGQPLDARKYFIILPDAIGAGGSSKPSDGLRARFPNYDYADMIAAQYRLVTEGLKLSHLRLVLGYSMGGMEAWLWGTTYPGFMDALVPMAAQPTAMSGRNWMMRRLIIDAIRTDPDWHDGNYTTQPKAIRMANAFFGIATSGGTIAYQTLAPTSAAADRLVDERLAAPFTADANDFLYQWEASRDYDPSKKLEAITAAVLAINAADDERNPPETGLMADAMKRVANGRLFLIPASAETRGHGTNAMAKFWKRQLQEFLDGVPRKAT